MLPRGTPRICGGTTLDRDSRRKAGQRGYGIGVSRMHPAGRVVGISNDYPYAKIFKPATLRKNPKKH